MSAIDLTRLLQEVAPNDPSGPNLEYDPAFGEVERIAQGKPEQVMGATVIPAEEPNWRELKTKTLALLGRSKDLRAGLHLTRALLRTDGFPGYADALGLLQGYVEKYWDSFHPLLDPDDGNDPTMRVNILVSLCDAETGLRAVRETPFVSGRTLGRFALRDVLVATGQLPAPATPQGGKPPATLAEIDAAFMECDPADLKATTEAVAQSAERVGALEAKLTAHVGPTRAASFAELTKLLKSASQILAERLSRRGLGEAPGAAETTAPGAKPAAGAAAGPKPMSGEILSREDAIRVLDKVSEYFARNEPSSPVPLLLHRAKRLVSKNFMEIVKDIAPAGLAQVETVGGVKGSEK